METTKWIVFGKGLLSNVLSEQLDEEIVFYIDNDKNKHYKKFENKFVYPIEVLKEINLNEYKILVASMYYEEIVNQLNLYDLREDIDYFDSRDLIIETYYNEDTWLHEFKHFSIKTAKMKKLGLSNFLNNYLRNYSNLNKEDPRIIYYNENCSLNDFNKDILEIVYQKKIKKNLINVNISKKKNVHFVLDNMTSRVFYDYLRENSYFNNNYFIVIDINNNSKFFEDVNSNIYRINISSLHEYSMNFRLINILNNSENIFIHYLLDSICDLFGNKFIKNLKYHWIIWGADLYSYIDISLFSEKTNKMFGHLIEDSTSFNTPNRKKFIEKVEVILAGFKGDYELVNKFYKNTAEHKWFNYPNVLNYKDLEKVNLNFGLKENKLKKIIVGNSGTITNNHIEVFDFLKNYLEEIDSIIIPLSYGEEKYISEIVDYGKAIFGSKFRPLYSFLERKEYIQLLNECDYVFMNHKRQQGYGNIALSIYLGKTVFLSQEVTTYQGLKSEGYKIYSIEALFKLKPISLKNLELSEIDKAKNNKLILNQGEIIKRIYVELFA